MKQKKNFQLNLTILQEKVLTTVLGLYLGKFPHAYGGATYFSKEADLIRNTVSRLSGKGGEIILKSEKEIMAIIRALEIYLGRYPNTYAGAKLWVEEAEELLQKVLENFKADVAHLLSV